jgi:hypothetical protein
MYSSPKNSSLIFSENNFLPNFVKFETKLWINGIYFSKNQKVNTKNKKYS